MKRADIPSHSPLPSEMIRVESFLSQLPTERLTQLDGTWRNFAEMARIPRPTGNERAISLFAKTRGELLQQRGLISEVTQDEANNVTWTIPPSARKYNKDDAAILLQGHLDMVCQTLDPMRDPAEHGVIPQVVREENGDWRVQSEGSTTTLGADNGVMTAFLMTLPELLRTMHIPHGPLKLIFTTAEEEGLTGAKALSPQNFDKFGKMINIDIEDEAEATIGSAAIGNTTTELSIQREPAPTNLTYKTLTIQGLQGGHSGMEINDLTRENAIKLATHILLGIPSVRIAEISADAPLLNAIQKDTTVSLGISEGDLPLLESAIIQTRAAISDHESPHATIQLTDTSDLPTTVATPRSSATMLALLAYLPHGVRDVDPQDSHVVQTSTNLATAVLSPDSSQLTIKHMSRSSFNAGIDTMRADIAAVATQVGAAVIEDTPSPQHGNP